MIKNKEQFLKELVTLPELKDNVMAYVFAINPDIKISSKNEFFDYVKSYYQRYKTQKPQIETTITQDNNEIDEWKNLDLRIKDVKLKSVKGFPESDVPFGIDFSNGKGLPKSMVILGGNATGKSSIYDAIEYVYCNKIGEAQLRNFKLNNSDRFKLFLEHFENGTENTYCKVETIDKSFDLQITPNIPKSVRERINPDTHFISDYDVYENGQLDYQKNNQKSFHNQIARSIGLESLLEFNKHLKTFVPYSRRKETTGINTANKNIENQNKFIETNNKAISERKTTLEQLQKDQKANPEENNLKLLIETLGKVRQNDLRSSFSYIRFEEVKQAFESAYNDFITKQVKNSGLSELQFLNLGLELLEKHEDCPFCENSQLSKQEIEGNSSQRIEKIKKLNEATQILNNSLNDLVDAFHNLLVELKNIKGTIIRELFELQEKVEFNNLFQKENAFLTSISNELADDFLVEISNLDENPNYLKDRNKYVFELLNNHTGFIKSLSEFEKMINRFFDERNFEIQKIDDLIRSKSQTKSSTERIIEINKEISDFEKQITDANQLIQKEKKTVEDFEAIRSLFTEIKESTKEYEKIVSNKVNETVTTAFAPIKLVVEEVLETYFKFDNRDLELIVSKVADEIDEETGEILSEVITAQIKPKNQNVKPQPVGKILNTFHYRLFSTMVGVAIAIASRKNTKINMPLVLDDIFYASDFENRARIETFIEALFKMFHDFTPELPLQLILFTHDQMIFESTIKVLNEIETLNEEDISFAKLFPHSEAKEVDGYKNLVYQFPTYFAKQVLNRSLETQ
jgi:hypothetical protein